MINVKIRSVPLNILSSVESLFKGFAANMYAPKLFIVALIVVENNLNAKNVKPLDRYQALMCPSTKK